ncbi:MAG: ABC transporter ATP-binding protein [Chloroflexota bacterium]|nr:ABC transporter ATP-binding protein [Chloroflexota bacterium]MDE3192261.1 ABC transporter ATP-binding protein [Chloroflexota bacterium]
MDTPIVEMARISKRFGDLQALAEVDLTVHKGDIHALVGENGAGKTTLMNILYGLYRPDAGTIRVRGTEAHIAGPRDAIALGIGMIHQHFMLVPPLTVAENVVLGDERGGPVLDTRGIEARVAELEKRFGIQAEPRAKIEDVPLGIQQRVEILKVLYRGSEILIFDEPTAVLTPQEVDDLFHIVRTLRDEGKTVILITHKLREVMAVSDHVTVLREGRNAAHLVTKETDPRAIAVAMVGRELRDIRVRPGNVGPAVLEITSLSAESDRGGLALKGVDVEVHAGEVVGIAGVGGNGQSELAQCILGLRKVTGGVIKVGGSDVAHDDPRRTRQRGVAYVPEDRRAEGLVLPFTLADNFILGRQDQPPYARRGILQGRVIRREGERLAKEFDVRPPDPDVEVGTLSGGNQQKVVLGREISESPRLIVANQPTRGLDIAATEYVHERLLEQRSRGCAILLISSELDEILDLSDRIAVMFEGRIVAVLPAAEATEERLGLLMAGHVEGVPA